MDEVFGVENFLNDITKGLRLSWCYEDFIISWIIIFIPPVAVHGVNLDSWCRVLSDVSYCFIVTYS